MERDKSAIDALTAAFYGAFTNRGGEADVDRLYRLFIPEANVIKNVGGALAVYDLHEFVEPRRALLRDGSITGFVEEETSETTEIFGNIAQRFSRYRKSWEAAGQTCNGGGAKSLQFVSTPDGWRIASLMWDDEL